MNVSRETIKKILVISGPTASGKSSLALKVAQEKDSVIKTISEKYMDSKKLITKIYGQIRIVQEQLDDRGTPAGTDDYIIDWLIAEIRGNISDYLYMKEENMLKFTVLLNEGDEWLRSAVGKYYLDTNKVEFEDNNLKDNSFQAFVGSCKNLK